MIDFPCITNFKLHQQLSGIEKLEVYWGVHCLHFPFKYQFTGPLPISQSVPLQEIKKTLWGP